MSRSFLTAAAARTQDMLARCRAAAAKLSCRCDPVDAVATLPELMEVIGRHLPDMYKLCARCVCRVWCEALEPLSQEAIYVCHLEAEAEQIEKAESYRALKIFQIANRLAQGRISLETARRQAASQNVGNRYHVGCSVSGEMWIRQTLLYE